MWCHTLMVSTLRLLYSLYMVLSVVDDVLYHFTHFLLASHNTVGFVANYILLIAPTV